ncbi:uncharacterized protein LOC105282612 isoform X2 [Ooceraea biroi]|nr:uncharacterized protein LOC105282612 isoform X2 [Ooceraea biroi]XP_026825107.1 uncharacterized protein LOC105282612 isoform X2 [Ooceraea biroi]XP_026825108.1 uncharacterized protein LOC105282612 isoform X2 [Ooceraea biroi]
MMKINYKNQFFLNWLLLLPFGLWPDKETKFTYLQATLFCCLMMSSIIFQLSRLFTAECSFDLIVRILSSTTFFATLTVPTILFWIHSKTMKYLLYKVEHMYDELHDRNEITICEKYRYIARRFTIIVVILLMCAMTFATVLLYWPFAFDILIPKNESYTIRTMEIVSKFFVVSKKYYFLVMVHLCSAASAGVIVLSAIGTMLISHFMHACGMFEIASYRIEQAMAVELLHIFNIRNEIIIYRKIICAIDIQRQAMEFTTFIVTNIETSIFFSTITTVLCISFNLFRIFQIESFRDQIEEALAHLSVVTVVLGLMFLTNTIGQEVTDHSNNVYVITYSVLWYLAPLRIQKLILFVLQRSNKIFILNVGGLFSASLECFATLISASISYFTFMYSMQ